MKREFIAADDYGQGAVWMVIDAETISDIEGKYPELDVVESPPDFLPASTLRSARQNRHYDIDDPPSGYLLRLVLDRR